MSIVPTPGVHAPRVGWFELFYDLIIVAAIYYFGHSLIKDPTWLTGMWIAVSAFITFVLWLLTSLSMNLFPGDDPLRRLLGLVQMICLVLAALSSGREEGLSNTTGFVSLAVAFACVAGTYWLASRSPVGPSQVARMLSLASAAVAVLLFVGALLVHDDRWTIDSPAPWLLGAAVAVIAAVLLGPALGSLARSGAIDDEHLAERLGQLIIIVLGESFISLVGALSDESVIPNPLFLVLTFLVVFSIWAVYFSSVLPAGVPTAPGRLRAWVLGHALLMFGAISAAAGFAALASTHVGIDDPGTKEWTALPLLSVMLAVSLLTWLAPRGSGRVIGLHLTVSAVLLVLVLLGILVTQGGTNWEVAVGSVAVMVDAVLSTRLTRPYARVATPAG